MIPIVSLTVLFISPFFLYIALKFRAAYKKTGDKKLYHLFYAFLPTFFALLLLSLPGLVTKNRILIDLIIDIYPLGLIIGMAYFTNVTFEILYKPILKKIIFFLILLLGLVISVFPAINMNEALVGIEDPFIFWEDTRGGLINILIGIAMMLPSLWFLGFFIWNGIAVKDKTAKVRAFLLATGMFFWAMVGLNDYIFGSFMDLMSLGLITGLFGFSFILCFLLALSYGKEITTTVPEKNQI